MEGFVCLHCNFWNTVDTLSCPDCGTTFIHEGEHKNIMDRLEPNCLIHRYAGSDLLEPAVFLKEGKSNVKVATKLRDFSKPLIIPRHKVYAFDQSVLGSIQALRNERTATIHRYDQQIGAHWQRLQPYKPM